MIRALQSGFHLALLLTSTAGIAVATETAEPSIAHRISGIVSLLERCAKDAQACESRPHRVWLQVRWNGSTLILGRKDPSSAFDQIRQQELFSQLSRASLPRPASLGQLRSWILGPRQGWKQLRVVFEKALSADSSLALVTELDAELGAPRAGTEETREWVLSSSGEVLYQSQGLFVGSDFGANPHFGRSQSRVSFDQREVKASWNQLEGLDWWVLSEELVPLPALSLADRFWRSLASWGLPAVQALMVLSWVTLLWIAAVSIRHRIRNRRARRGSPPEVESPQQHNESTAVEVQIPKLVVAEPSAPARIAPVERPQNWGHSILKSRTFHELGRRLMVLVADEVASPVLFLEFHRDSGMALFRDQVGLQPQQVPLSMRVPVSDISGHFQDQPAFQGFMLGRLGISHFEVLELRSSPADGLRSQLLGLFVILQPGVASFESRPHLETLLLQAGRYYDAFLRPRPPQIRA
jgi:hypothetical protein